MDLQQSHFQRNRKNRKRTESVGVVSCWPIMLFRPVCRKHHPQDPQDLPGQRLASRWASCHITQRPSRLVSFLFFVFSSCIIWVEAILKVVSSNLNCLFNFDLEIYKVYGLLRLLFQPLLSPSVVFPNPSCSLSTAGAAGTAGVGRGAKGTVGAAGSLAAVGELVVASADLEAFAEPIGLS